MIYYHGLTIDVDATAVEVLAGGHGFVSFRRREQLGAAATIAQSIALDSGAFSAWKAGEPITDWKPYYNWLESCFRLPVVDFAVIPDVVEGGEKENDALLHQWPFADRGAPVWHLHESLERLVRLCDAWPRVCLGSSAQYAVVGTRAWWSRMAEAMKAVCDGDGYPITKLHGLRMLNPSVFSQLPLASADSTNIARNLGSAKWEGPYAPPSKAARAKVLRQRIESTQAPQRWSFKIKRTLPLLRQK